MFIWEKELNNMPNTIESVQTIATVADGLFFDIKVDGFSKDKVVAYNVLMSAATYLKTGRPLIGNRTLKFFGL